MKQCLNSISAQLQLKLTPIVVFLDVLIRDRVFGVAHRLSESTLDLRQGLVRVLTGSQLRLVSTSVSPSCSQLVLVDFEVVELRCGPQVGN